MKKKFIIYTLGCKVNQYDSQNIREKLLSAGLEESRDSGKADLCVVNTCTVTSGADRDSLYAVRRLNRRNPGARMVVTGCLAQRDRDLISADLVVRNTEKNRLAAIAAARFPGLFTKTRQPRLRGEQISFFEGRTRAFLKIQDGCDNFCSYCKVPFVRPVLSSKPLPGILREARALAASGYREIVLTGICLGRYVSRGRKLTDVIRSLESVEGLARIRLSSIEALHVTPGLAGLLSESPKLCPHLHIPLQSGSDRILALMNRPYGRDRFRRLIRQLKFRVKDFCFTTDVMVGFPGETEADFRQTLELVTELEPLKVHVFAFSSRPGTAASRLTQTICPDRMKERCARMNQAARQAGEKERNKFLGRRMQALIECRTPDKSGWEGFTPNYIPLVVRSGRLKPNSLVRVRLDSLYGPAVSAFPVFG